MIVKARKYCKENGEAQYSKYLNHYGHCLSDQFPCLFGALGKTSILFGGETGWCMVMEIGTHFSLPFVLRWSEDATKLRLDILARSYSESELVLACLYAIIGDKSGDLAAELNLQRGHSHFFKKCLYKFAADVETYRALSDGVKGAMKEVKNCGDFTTLNTECLAV